ncbi:unnamed protein product [Tetraodon nigroviridis]|uniref:(spotted green pufferfish) hypothetical protein n=1 Tax=Tetraodon nigroviridis TaxID=99883 RepID=Q4S3Q4_TETNG|nr:unnamed protein product [Tetraodon nigroviridis]
MEAVLNRKPEDLEDYYGILGCDELSSTEQILNEYKIRALACHPDKHLDNPAAGDYCHRCFRWAADSPSTLLQRFRNYEI